MPERYGTLSVLDNLATYGNTNVLAFGEAEMNGFVQQILDAYRALKDDIVGDLVGYTTERETTYGTNATTGEMVDLDEYGLADAQKLPFAPASVGFPLRKRGYTVQYTRDYLATTSPLEFARQVLGATEADERRIYAELRRSLLKATNNTTYVDRLTDLKTYTVRALVNADGNAIPPNPITGVSYDAATHTHYLATATFVAANLVSLIETVREHRPAASLRVYINSAQETTVRGFSGFNAYIDARIVYGTTADRAAQTVDIANTEDRAIGFFSQAEVWVKPWVPASYVVCFDAMAPEPVLAWRQPTGGHAQSVNLRLVANLDRHPLHAQAWEHIYGLAPWNRIAAAVMYVAGASYVNYTGA